MTGFAFNRRILPALLSVASLAAAGWPVTTMGTLSSGIEAVPARHPKKQVKARKRLKYAEPQGSWPRSKNPPTKRRLKGNRLHVSKRVRRKHRRARL